MNQSQQIYDKVFQYSNFGLEEYGRDIHFMHTTLEFTFSSEDSDLDDIVSSFNLSKDIGDLTYDVHDFGSKFLGNYYSEGFPLGYEMIHEAITCRHRSALLFGLLLLKGYDVSPVATPPEVVYALKESHCFVKMENSIILDPSIPFVGTYKELRDLQRKRGKPVWFHKNAVQLVPSLRKI